MKSEVREFLDEYKAIAGGYIAPVCERELTPAQLERVAAKVEELLFTGDNEMLQRYQCPQARRLAMFAEWMERLCEMDALWEFVEGPCVEFSDFAQYYTAQYDSLLYPVNNRPPTEEQMVSVEMLFNEMIDTPNLATKLRQVDSREQVMALLSDAWQHWLTSYKRNYDDVQQAIANGEIDHPEYLSDEDYADLFR